MDASFLDINPRGRQNRCGLVNYPITEPITLLVIPQSWLGTFNLSKVALRPITEVLLTLAKRT